MSHRTLTLLFAFVCAAASPPVGRIAAQEQAPAPNAVAQTPQATGQNAEQNPGQQAPAKKVWTNDDMNGLHGQPLISTSSPSATKSFATGQKPATKGKDAKWYRENISKLQAKVPPLDDQIAELQAAIDGKPTGDGTESARPRGVKADSWPVEMDNLKKQRSDILSKIDALYDEARRNDIPASALPLEQ